MNKKKKKIVLIVIDGLADNFIPEFHNQTPLEKAKTPNMDFFTQHGQCGLIIPWREKNKLPTSEDTHLALFGYSPKKDNPGRGVLEILGIGEKIFPNDLCLRGNFATVNENFEIIDRRAQRIENTEKLIEALNKIKIKDAKVIVRKAFGHRIGIIIRSRKKLQKISSNDPKKINVKVLKINPKCFTQKVIEEFLEKTYQILNNHPLNKQRVKGKKLPANFILFRGAGKFKKVRSFFEKYKLKAAYIAGGTLYKGIGRYLGMEEIKVKGANGLPTTNLKGKFKSIRKGIKKFDFIFLHIKAADNFAEDGNYIGKKKFLEKIDKSLKFLRNLKNIILIITGDHATCSLKKSHCNLLNPVVIFDSDLINKNNGFLKFSERECSKGFIINQLNFLRNFLKNKKLLS